MLVKTFGCAIIGINAIIVTIEVNSEKGIQFFLVGLPDNAVKESQQRIVASFSNLGYKFPKKLIEKIKLNNLQVWVAADNLAIASARRGYNPMMSFSGSNGYDDYSPLSTVMAGVKVQF